MVIVPYPRIVGNKLQMAAKSTLVDRRAVFKGIQPIMDLDEVPQLDTGKWAFSANALEKMMQNKNLYCHCTSIIYHSKMQIDYRRLQKGGNR